MIPPPFAFQVVDGWDRSCAERIVDAHRAGSMREHHRRGDGHVAYGSPIDVMIEIDRQVVDPGDSLTDDAFVDRAVSILRVALSRSDEEHMERMQIAGNALDVAGRLTAPDMLPSRMMNAMSASPVVPHVFGEVVTNSNGWTASMRPDPEGRVLPSIVTLHQSRGMVHLERLRTRIHDVATLDPMERLRLEADLAGLLTQAAAINRTTA